MQSTELNQLMYQQDMQHIVPTHKFLEKPYLRQEQFY